MKKNIICCLLIFAFSLCFSGCGGEDGEIVISGTADASEEAVDEGEKAPDQAKPEDADKTESAFVYVIGAVNKPGVYEVPAGTRIFKLIDSAGGLREDAAAEALNLAAPVQDGSVIRVPDREEYEESLNAAGIQEIPAGGIAAGPIEGDRTSYGTDSKGLININTASVSELTLLNGIGESRAQAIISYREENGAFRSIEEIKNVSGIKDGLFNKIRDQITV